MESKQEGYNYVLEQVAPKVSALYRYYQNKDLTLEDKEDTMEKLETLIKKKYINATYISRIMLIVDYYNRGMYSNYQIELQNYIMRIDIFLEDY